MDKILDSFDGFCAFFLFVGGFSVFAFNIVPSLLFNLSNIQPFDLSPHNDFWFLEDSGYNDIPLDPYSKESVIRFIVVNFLDCIFSLNTDSIKHNYYEIINNEGFYHLLKNIFKHKDIATESISTITNRFFRGQMLDFFYQLNECQNFEQFKLMPKDKKVIIYLLKYIKTVYLT